MTPDPYAIPAPDALAGIVTKAEALRLGVFALCDRIKAEGGDTRAAVLGQYRKQFADVADQFNRMHTVLAAFVTTFPTVDAYLDLRPGLPLTALVKTASFDRMSLGPAEAGG